MRPPVSSQPQRIALLLCTCFSARIIAHAADRNLIAITMITPDDMRRLGITTIPEALRLVQGRITVRC